MTEKEMRQIEDEMTKLKLKIDELTPGITDPSATDLCGIAVSIRVKTMSLHAYFTTLHILGYDACWYNDVKSYLIEPLYAF